MSLKDIQRGFPPLRHDKRFARNGHLPAAGAFRGFVDGINTAAGVLRKVTVVQTEILQGVSTGSLGAVDHWRGHLITGPDTTEIVHHVGLAPIILGTTVAPAIVIAMVDVATNTVVDSVAMSYSNTKSVTDLYLDDITHAKHSWACDPSTEYGFHMHTVDGAHPVYWSIGELAVARADTAGSAISDPGSYAVGAPIYVDDIGEVLTKATEIRKHGAGHLFNWSWDGIAPPNVTSAAFTPHLVSPGAVPPSAATPGFFVDLTNRGTLRRGVPIKFAARGRTTSGTTNAIRLVDQAGTQLAILSGFTTTVGWKTTTTTIPATTTSLHVEFKSDGAATMNIYAASCAQWEA